MMQSVNINPEWRKYQHKLQRHNTARAKGRQIFRWSISLCLLAGSVYALALGFKAIPFHDIMTGIQRFSENRWSADDENSQRKKRIAKKDIQTILNNRNFINLNEKYFELNAGEQHYKVTTSLDIGLQNFILKKLDRLNHVKRGKPRYAALIAMEPASGRILAMAGFEPGQPNSNPCINSNYPAASIFKIITAAAAIEECGFTPNSRLTFNGGKYTLYKYQIKNSVNKYSNKITFKNAFAQSVNPVFGKLGSLYLGKETLEKYAAAFAFNRNIDFEVPLSPSVVSLTDRPYHWAEIACGFNRQTQISPLHGALLSGTILNNGKMMEPTIVEQIENGDGNIIYSSHTSPLSQVIRPETSRQIKTLMKTTIRSGTGRKSFRGYRRDTVLSKLNIGGKTGSISNRKHDIRYDWFVGFAEDKKGSRQIAVSVVVGHQKYIGTRATQYARMAIRHYFQDYFATNDKDIKKTHRS